VNVDRDFWQGRRVLITGHTGFKGSWLALWLQSLGARVTGLSGAVPTRPSLYELAQVGQHMQELQLDIRDQPAVARALADCGAEVVFHLAAQPMVRRSLREPALTYEVNVMGTVSVLEAARRVQGLRALVLITSDKCYDNSAGGSARFTESDPLGGDDPYSSSKACAELVAGAYRRSYFADDGGAMLATARAGNVIGGGDWGEDRLLADVIRAVEADRPLLVRNPRAVRPWQHVLSPLGGYLLLAQRLCEGPSAARAWNFGPGRQDERTVGWVLERMRALWGDRLSWTLDEGTNPPEAGHLALDSSAAEHRLGWTRGCDLDEGLRLVVEWHVAHMAGEQMREVSLGQIARLG
jgi:CDP-glucose 4,6-dehydratase